MNLPKVSIALPVYNGADYLHEALQSFQEQIYPHFELVICDNVSNDLTSEIAGEFARLDPRFIYSRQTDHLDALQNFLRAYRMTNRGYKYFLWACDDNIWAPTFLEKTVSYMESHPECVLCGVFVHHFHDDGQIYYRNYVSIPWYFKKFRLLQFTFERRCGYSIYGLLRRSTLDSIRLEFDCRCYVDTWILLQMRALGTIHLIEEDLLAFRAGGLSTTKSDPYVAHIVDLICSEDELNILFSLKGLSILEKYMLAQKMTYQALRHHKPDTVRRWWLAPAYIASNCMNWYRSKNPRK
jgi:glycosyltransferase involved in cell wall biosynthesis